MPEKTVTEKLYFVLLPFVASFLGWALLLRFLPIKDERDLLNRLLASFFSSITIGSFCLFSLYGATPWLFNGADVAMDAIGFPRLIGQFWIFGTVFAFTGMPGWWLMGGIARFLDRRGHSMVESLLNSAADRVSKTGST